MTKNLLPLLLISSIAISQIKSNVEPAFEFFSNYHHVRDFTISSNQNEAYFSIVSPNEKLSAIAYIKKVKEQWSKPELVSFTGKYKDLEPFLSTDGLKLYFASNRPLTESGEPKDFDIWYVERKNTKSEWSSPINVGSPINTTADEFYPTVANNKNLYYTSDSDKSMGKDDIFMSVWNGENYKIPVRLEETINSIGFEFNAYISPDETFLIYTIYGSSDGLGSGDLYISFKDNEGNWKKSFNLKEFNSESMDYCPFYDASTQTLYFTSKRSLPATKSFKTIEEFESEIQKYQNGLSRIYKVSLKDVLEKN
ncbi:hypothetical protein EQG68_06720 [Flavobacterium piscinae]|uniref:Exo-alpha-sialidase n=2 Tax=Flavobacterium piscinae TaxID=2506424 RepID=A0A4Q1KQU0_9FLAO|nr:PD40 domain-containing protein [Flavobacterium piscinae]RXR32513.1 hypothetical protein EQG68_06720 [Flavobacterium piscinae]